jgi:cardiolipin synthase
VRILVPGHTDIPAVRALTRAGYRELLRSGARIWEWHGPMLHAKTILVDQWWYKVGSSNLNPTSYLSNYELDVLVEDPGLCQAVAQGYRRDLSQAVEIVLRPRRGPRSLSARVPAAVAEADAIPKGPARALARGERTRRTVVALRKVAGGARRSLVGAFLFAVIGAGALFLAIPDVMAYVVAAGCFALAGLAIGRLIESRRDRDD